MPQQCFFQRRWMTRLATPLVLLLAPTGFVSASVQHPPGKQASSNVHVLAHIPLGRAFTVTDVEIEQELSRPYVYVSRMHAGARSAGFNIISVKDPNKAAVLYSWQIENPELHRGMGGMAPTYLKSRGRYYFVQSFQWAPGGPDHDLGGIVFDVTGLPDVTKIREVGRFRLPEYPGGFHELFSYKHSDGRALMFAEISGPFAHVYDIDAFVSGDAKQGLVARIPEPVNPPGPQQRCGSGCGYHDFYVGYDPASQQDRFYGAGAGGYHVYDVTKVEEPRLLTSVTGIAGVANGHTFTPTPDGRYALSMSAPHYQHAVVRIFDLKAGLEGQARTISRPIGAWTADWKNVSHNTEVRWPYVFVSAYEDGLQVINMMDPTNPYTVGYYDTYDGPHQRGWGGIDNPEGGNEVSSGAFGIDVRNADGLIVISDFNTGFWALKMDGFDGWNGHRWGMPNNSSAQDWDNGPDGVRKPARVSAR